MSGHRLLIRSRALRRWLLWPLCAARGHREVFRLPAGAAIDANGRCSCGRRWQQHPVHAERTQR